MLKLLKIFSNHCKMDTTEAIRYMGLQVLDSMKDNLDSDVYAVTKKLITNADRKKLLKKLSRFLQPLIDLHSKGEATVENLKELDYFKEDAKITQDEVDNLIQQAVIANTICNALKEIDPQTLGALENMASAFTEQFESNLTDDDRINISQIQNSEVNPMDILSKTLSSMNENSSPDDLVQEAIKNAGSLGINENLLQQVQNIIPSMLNGLEEKPSDKTSLLKKFESIGGGLPEDKKRR